MEMKGRGPGTLCPGFNPLRPTDACIHLGDLGDVCCMFCMKCVCVLYEVCVCVV